MPHQKTHGPWEMTYQIFSQNIPGSILQVSWTEPESWVFLAEHPIHTVDE
ncbi:MAG TPA: hypothetical protein VEH86_04845 [Candidatus Acidoferrum sp.]|nr:hypothetical protein [Candidatus Acidoferrum sp.]